MVTSPLRLLPVLLSLCIISIIHLCPGVVSTSPLSFDVQFIPWGYDPQEVGFHQIIAPRNLSSRIHASRPYTAHQKSQVLPRKKRKKFVPDRCDCSKQIDGVMYMRPAPLRDEATGDVASFKMTLCYRINPRQADDGTEFNHGGRNIGLFLFLVPYPWNSNDERIEVGLHSKCIEAKMKQYSSIGGDAVVCAHVHYDSAKELLITNVLVDDHSCTCGRKLNRSSMPREAAVGFASINAGDPIELRNIITWAFHSKLESKDPPLMTTQPAQVETPTGGEESSWPIDRGQQRFRVDPWTRNAELNLQYQRNWQRNWQLTCSLSISVGYGNTNGDMD
ncbi:uncharacterized protein LOC100501661 precursor [Zea mays]|jgi:hypothetical protein|uniref:Uncharacterized protein n=1 Tax=Zea mays TaxID=4577 RepID=C4J500_MAIZE|nr:uncharacterized protein LOC100501661 precursor [Zea mays]ACR36250.1 unknown [Zea mays]ONM40523.1 hypothetical protein ZEAMMB73_Zm00001d044235 [Zea mays]|eukprot:NP_001183268.1 uncharacterized protein LOC100501661 precursor [Zea mays]